MEKGMKDIGKMESFMAKEKRTCMMVLYLMESGFKGDLMAREPVYTLMELNTRKKKW